MTKPPISNDAHKPQEIAELVETAGVSKALLPAGQMLVLAILAGAFIGFGAATYTMIMTGVDSAYGPARLLGGVGFALGLILVIVGGAELFTGNALMVMAAVDRKIKINQLLRNWIIVFIGNLIGAAGLAVAFGLSGLLNGHMGETAINIAAAKTTLSPLEAFVRGALCNALVCLAVWLTFAARTVTGKILAILWPVAGFVLLGLEHSIANLFFFPLGWAAAAAASGAEATAQISVGAALANLFWVTLGNILGGAGGVALAYRFAFHGPKRGI
ncbi:MAG: formate/nitrite transporter family protein [Rhizobiaceae bacterium]